MVCMETLHRRTITVGGHETVWPYSREHVMGRTYSKGFGVLPSTSKLRVACDCRRYGLITF
jgi:hypothetical protein